MSCIEYGCLILAAIANNALKVSNSSSGKFKAGVQINLIYFTQPRYSSCVCMSLANVISKDGILKMPFAVLVTKSGERAVFCLENRCILI